MIKYIEIQNFRSYNDPQKIDFKPNREENLYFKNVSNSSILKSIALFGENGGGKTSTLEALNAFLVEMIGKRDYSYRTHSFSVRKKSSSITKFEIMFNFDGDEVLVKYSIDSNLTKKSIIDETLSINNIVFDRKINFKDKKIPEDILMVRHGYFNDFFNEEVKTVLDKLYKFLGNAIYYHCDEKKIATFSEMIEFDDGSRIILKDKSYLKNKEAFERINNFLTNNYLFTINTLELEKNSLELNENYRFLFANYGTNMSIPFYNESSGNKDLLLFVQFFDYIINNGGLLFVDELNSSFHTELSSMLIKYFNEKSTQSQFIFATQDTNLMNSDLLRADQIYFINRDKNMQSIVDRLSNYAVRPTQNYQKLYRSSVVSRLPIFKRVYKNE